GQTSPRVRIPPSPLFDIFWRQKKNGALTSLHRQRGNYTRILVERISAGRAPEPRSSSKQNLQRPGDAVIKGRKNPLAGTAGRTVPPARSGYGKLEWRRDGGINKRGRVGDGRLSDSDRGESSSPPSHARKCPTAQQRLWIYFGF